MKQEQLPAQDEATEVAPGVVRIQLPIEMPGLGHVNCYVLEDERGVTLVDPGLPDPDSHKELAARLARIGIPLERVHSIVVTHSHPDHFGGAGRLHAEHGSELVAHEAFSTMFDHAEILRDVLYCDVGVEDLPERESPWGGETMRITADELDFIRDWDDLSKQGLLSMVPTVRVTDKEVMRLGGSEWVVVHTPGHTGDHICLFDPEHGTLLSGDHVLPTITPHISGMSEDEDTLQTFFEGLATVAAMDGVTRALPAHGLPFDDVSGRVEEIVDHHRERLTKLESIAAEIGEDTVTAYSQRLFRERSWGPMAESETFAHLEHLRLRGKLSASTDDRGVIRYRPAD